MLRLTTMFFLFFCLAAPAAEPLRQADLDAVYADALLSERPSRRYAKALVDELLRIHHPDALSLLARYNAIRSPREILADADNGPVLSAPIQIASAEDSLEHLNILAEARRLGAETVTRQRLAAAAAEQSRRQAETWEREKLQRETAERERAKRREYELREERLRTEQLEAAREENERRLRLAAEEDRVRREKEQQLHQEAAAALKQNEQDIAYVEAVHRNLPRLEPHAAVLIFRLIDQGIPAGQLLYQRHRALRPDADLERFRKYSDSDLLLARNGIQKLLDEEADAIARELRAEEAKFLEQKNAIDMLRQDINNIKKSDPVTNTIWVDPRTWQAMEKDLRILLLLGAAASFAQRHEGATPFAAVRSFADNTLLGNMNGPDNIRIY